MFDAFTKATGTKVNAVFLTNGLEERVKAEGQNSPADVILQVDAAKLAGAVDMGITQPVAPRSWKLDVPAHLRDPDGQLVRHHASVARDLCIQGPRAAKRDDL